MLISLQNMSFLSKKHMIFCFKNLIFSEYEWAIANRSWEWNNLSNVICFQNKVWYPRYSILKNSAIFEIFLSTEWFCLNYCYFLLQKIWYFVTHFLQKTELWPADVVNICKLRTIWHWGFGKYHLKSSQLKRFNHKTITRSGGSKKTLFFVWGRRME